MRRTGVIITRDSPDKPLWRTILASTPVTAVIDSLVDDYQNTPREPKAGPPYPSSGYPYPQTAGGKRKTAWALLGLGSALGVGALCMFIGVKSSQSGPPPQREIDFLGTPPALSSVPAPSPANTGHALAPEMRSKYQIALAEKRRKLVLESQQLRKEFDAKCYGPFDKLRPSQEKRLERFCERNNHRHMLVLVQLFDIDKKLGRR